MLALLIAAGALGSDNIATPGPLLAAPEAIVSVPRVAATAAISTGIPLGAPVWQLPLDPSDTAPYALDFTPLLDSGALIASVLRLTMSAAGAATGVEIATTPPCGPVITTDGAHVQIWFEVDPNDDAAGAFDGAGLQVAVAVLIRTNQTPPREFERTAVLTVRQL